MSLKRLTINSATEAHLCPRRAVEIQHRSVCEKPGKSLRDVLCFQGASVCVQEAQQERERGVEAGGAPLLKMREGSVKGELLC